MDEPKSVIYLRSKEDNMIKKYKTMGHIDKDQNGLFNRYFQPAFSALVKDIKQGKINNVKLEPSSVSRSMEAFSRITKCLKEYKVKTEII